MKMIKLQALLLAFLMIVSITACGAKPAKVPASSAAPKTQSSEPAAVSSKSEQVPKIEKTSAKKEEKTEVKESPAEKGVKFTTSGLPVTFTFPEDWIKTENPQFDLVCEKGDISFFAHVFSAEYMAGRGVSDIHDYYFGNLVANLDYTCIKDAEFLKDDEKKITLYDYVAEIEGDETCIRFAIIEFLGSDAPTLWCSSSVYTYELETFDEIWYSIVTSATCEQEFADVNVGEQKNSDSFEITTAAAPIIFTFPADWKDITAESKNHLYAKNAKGDVIAYSHTAEESENVPRNKIFDAYTQQALDLRKNVEIIREKTTTTSADGVSVISQVYQGETDGKVYYDCSALVSFGESGPVAWLLFSCDVKDSAECLPVWEKILNSARLTEEAAKQLEQSKSQTQSKPQNAAPAGSTNPADYHPTDFAVAMALQMVGGKYACTEIAECIANARGTTAWMPVNRGSGMSYMLAPENFLKMGRQVSVEEIQPGDILYYPNGGRGYSHVAVYLENGMAIHGNWETDKTTRIRNAFYRPPSHIIRIE